MSCLSKVTSLVIISWILARKGDILCSKSFKGESESLVWLIDSLRRGDCALITFLEVQHSLSEHAMSDSGSDRSKASLPVRPFRVSEVC